jgi:hypothetical protein
MIWIFYDESKTAFMKILSRASRGMLQKEKLLFIQGILNYPDP